MITLGIIGCGWVTETLHLPVVRQLDGIRLHSACDALDGRLRLVCKGRSPRLLIVDTRDDSLVALRRPPIVLEEGFG